MLQTIRCIYITINMKNIVIFGPPGSGKGTQSNHIINKYQLTHVSTGDVIRSEIKAKSEIGQQVESLIENGQLVPDQLIVELLAEWLEKQNDSNGIIFDGFPRTTNQAVALKQMLQKQGQDVDLMLSLEVPKEELVSRLVKRGQDSGRSDDNLATIEKRITVYEEVTAPVIDFYKKENTYVSINGVGSEKEIFATICSHIDTL